MSTIKDKLHFNYNNKSSEEFGLIAINLDNGMYSEMFMPTRSINETKPEGRDVPIFHGITTEKREFQLTLAFEKGFHKDMIAGIVDWLFTEQYKPLYFEGGLDRIMFSIVSGDSSLVHDGMNNGYFTVNVETNSSYKYSRIIEHKIGDRKRYSISNRGHKEVFPEYEFKKIGKGDIKFKMNGKNVLIINLEDGESIKIDSLREIIETDIPGAYRYNNITAGELEDLYLKKGLSKIEIEGDADISLKYREIFLF